MQIVTIKMQRELVELIDLYAMNHGYNRSEVIRMAIVEFLSVRGVKVNG